MAWTRPLCVATLIALAMTHTPVIANEPTGSNLPDIYPQIACGEFTSLLVDDAPIISYEQIFHSEHDLDFISIHRLHPGPDDTPGQWLAITHRGEYDIIDVYQRVDAGWRLRLQWTSAGFFDDDGRYHRQSTLLTPSLLTLTTPGGDTFHLLHLSNRHPGTGAFRDDLVFHLQSEGRMDRVQIENPIEGYARLFEDQAFNHDVNESVWKGVQFDFTVSPPTFHFHIWQDGDGNCCPSAGQVRGTLGLNDDGGLVVTAATRLPPDPEHARE